MSGKENRSPEGALQRAVFAEAEKRLVIPDGRKAVIVLAIDMQGAEIGAAIVTKRGWVIEPTLTYENFKGQDRSNIRFTTRILF